MHDFVGGTLLEHPPLRSPRSRAWFRWWWPAGCCCWFVYRRVQVGAPDPLSVALGRVYTLLQRKYYFDELYDRLFVRRPIGSPAVHLPLD
jgi:hypothetical protein